MTRYKARRNSLSPGAQNQLEQATDDNLHVVPEGGEGDVESEDPSDVDHGESASEYQSTQFGGGSSSRVSAEEQASSAKKIAEQLSLKESRKIFRLRVMVLFVLIVAAFVITGIVFKITTNGQVEQFTTQYEGAAHRVVDVFDDIMNRMGSVAGLSVSYTSYGTHHLDTSTNSHGTPWPFVTLDDFSPKARSVLQLSGALMVGMSPMVLGPLFYEWNDYVVHPESTEWM